MFSIIEIVENGSCLVHRWQCRTRSTWRASFESTTVGRCRTIKKFDRSSILESKYFELFRLITTILKLSTFDYKLDPVNYEQDGSLEKIRNERGYSYMDEIECSPNKLLNYCEQLKMFFQEHIHSDEEIRLVPYSLPYFRTDHFIAASFFLASDSCWKDPATLTFEIETIDGFESKWWPEIWSLYLPEFIIVSL